MELTRVVNIRESFYDVYMGRPGKGLEGPFGNPFKMGTGGRAKCISEFATYFHARIDYDLDFKRQVLRLRGKRLGCFCVPKPCHAEVYAGYLNEMTDEIWEREVADTKARIDRRLGPTTADRLAVLRDEKIGDCLLCCLCKGRKNVVFGVGNPNANLMFVGEGPGADEDAEGEPFVGRAGKLLDGMVAAMGLQRANVYIANTVKCRPTMDEERTRNRPPSPAEQEACSPFLVEQIDIVRPKVIVALGAIAAKWFVPDLGGIMSARGKWVKWREYDVMPTYHPAFLLRDPRAKKPAWRDLQAVVKRLDGIG